MVPCHRRQRQPSSGASMNEPVGEESYLEFRPVGERVEEEDVGVEVISGSLCVECGGSGDTRMLTTKKSGI